MVMMSFGKYSLAEYNGVICCRDCIRFNCSLKDVFKSFSVWMPNHWEACSSSLIFLAIFWASWANGKNLLGCLTYIPPSVCKGVFTWSWQKDNPRSCSSKRSGAYSCISCSSGVSLRTGSRVYWCWLAYRSVTSVLWNLWLNRWVCRCLVW